MKKYEFTGETRNEPTRQLKRIRRCRDGLIGGWIESENNLSHVGDCFVFDDAKVTGNAMVDGNTKVCDRAIITGEARVSGSPFIHGSVHIYGSATIGGQSNVGGTAIVHGNATIDMYTIVKDRAEVCGAVLVTDFTIVSDTASVGGNLILAGNASVHGGAVLRGKGIVQGENDYMYIGGLHHCVTLQKNGLATIGCTTRTIKEWLSLPLENLHKMSEMPMSKFLELKRILTPILEQWSINNVKEV